MSDDEIIYQSRLAKRLYWRKRPLAEAIADAICDRMEAEGVTEADLERLGVLLPVAS